MNRNTTLFLTIVRHGRTSYNERYITQGQLDVPLDEVGIKQARDAGNALKGEHFDCVYTSDLCRTIQTASEIIKLIDNSSNHRLIIKHDALLRERGYGIMEDKPYSDLKDAANKAGFFGPDEENRYTPKGGESDEQVLKRAKRFVENLCTDFRDVSKLSKNDSLNVLIVSHGVLITQMIKYFVSCFHCDGIAKDRLDYILETGNVPNTGISKFQLIINERGKLSFVSCSLFCSDKHSCNPS